ncbi:MAG: hypothetical protein M1821_004181 [Bathelium mastoideum]|nr:MAG: hypothetical protein M1821_004181 [Bathelium mastoideum]
MRPEDESAERQRKRRRYSDDSSDMERPTGRRMPPSREDSARQGRRAEKRRSSSVNEDDRVKDSNRIGRKRDQRSPIGDRDDSRRGKIGEDDIGRAHGKGRSSGNGFRSRGRSHSPDDFDADTRYRRAKGSDSDSATERRRHRYRRRDRSRDRDPDSEEERPRDKYRRRDRSRDRDHCREKRQSRIQRSRSPHRDRRRSRSPRRRYLEPPSRNSPPPNRSHDPLPSQLDAFRALPRTGHTPPPNDKPIPKEKPNFNPTGLLARETNLVEGTDIVLKYNEPPEARKPAAAQAWRLFIFKGADVMETVELGTRSVWLLGREAKVADLLVAHPSCSGQHAVVQFRHTTKTGKRGEPRAGVRPYLLDLESANGTWLNGAKVESRRYVELRSGDVVKLGSSEREYVIMLPPKEG